MPEHKSVNMPLAIWHHTGSACCSSTASLDGRECRTTCAAVFDTLEGEVERHPLDLESDVGVWHMLGLLVLRHVLQ